MTTPTAPAMPRGWRANKTARQCARCLGSVKPGEGMFTDTGNRRVTEHLPGQCPPPPVRPNKFAGPCARCGAQVPAEAGLVYRDPSGAWKVAHLAGACPECLNEDAPVAAPAAKPAERARSNRFAGTCATCGDEVAENAGRLYRGAKGGWEVSHLEGACPADPEGMPDIPAGRYAVPSAGDRQSLDFWEVRRAGLTRVLRIVGGREPSRVQGDELAAALEAIAAAGPELARDRYADETENCWKCDIHLTDDLSRLVKIGPDCCKAVYGCTQRQRLAAIAAGAD